MPELNAILTTRRDYKDVSLTFARNPVTSDVVTVTGEDAVKRALKLILMTRVGETPFYPNFGSRLTQLLFEPIDPITTVLVQHEIEDVITAFEPRVSIIDVIVTPDTDSLGYNVDLTFSLVNMVEPITLTLYLSRLR